MRLVTLLVVTLVFCTGEAREDALVRRQEECDVVTAQLEPVVTACLAGPLACVVEADFEDFVDPFLCTPGAGTRERYDTFVECRGQLFADEIWGGTCGGPQGSSGRRCYTFVDQSIDDLASSAIAACCPVNVTADNCSDECATQLETLSTQLGCCTQTAVFTIFFQTCDGSTTLRSLYEFCEVSLEEPCLHLYSTGTKMAMSAFTVAASVLLSTIGLLAIY